MKQANGQLCNIDAPSQPLANPPSCITAIYAKKMQELNIDALYKLGYNATIPTPITSNLWILTSATELNPAGIMLIYPDKAPKSIKVEKPIHVLCLSPACSARSQHFHLPPYYENHEMTINISFNTANLNKMTISSP